MPTYDSSDRSHIPALVRAWERYYHERGWNGSPWKLHDVACAKARQGKKPKVCA